MAIRELYIRNFALISQLDIDLDRGLTVITGETGAGKSIILGALNLLLGSRAEANMIRYGQDQCEVSASFSIEGLDSVSAWLAEHDFQAAGELEHSCFIRRIVRRDKPSKCYINDRASTLGSLKELGTLLVDLHGQHEHQSLLRAYTQRNILDQFAGHNNELALTADLAKKINKINSELQAISNSNNDASERLDLLSFQLNELEEANLLENEFESLAAEQSLLSNTEVLRHGLEGALDALHHNEQSNVSTLLGQQINELQGLAQLDSQLNSSVEQLNTALSLIDDSQSHLERGLARVSSDPERLMEIDSRIDLLVNLARKHRCQEAELLDKLDQLKQERERLEGTQAAPEKLQSELNELQKQYRKMSMIVSANRQAVAAKLSKQISLQMQDLGMEGGRFQIQVRPQSENLKTSEHGIDQIDFLVSTNQGSPLQALNKTASGGELSRISLAIQVIASHSAQTPSLIFDEVDVGVGGKVAGIVGERLSELGANTQVLCITHLPQVAAQGDHHFVVEKSAQAQQTESKLYQLDDNGRVNEIARMLGGTEVTKQTRAHAEEMLVRSKVNFQAAS